MFQCNDLRGEPPFLPFPNSLPHLQWCLFYSLLETPLQFSQVPKLPFYGSFPPIKWDQLPIFGLQVPQDACANIFYGVSLLVLFLSAYIFFSFCLVLPIKQFRFASFPPMSTPLLSKCDHLLSPVKFGFALFND